MPKGVPKPHELSKAIIIVIATVIATEVVHYYLQQTKPRTTGELG